MAKKALGGVVRQVRTRLAAELHRDLTDRQLLERFVQQHDEAAFTALVQRHERRVHAALTRVLKDPADVEDAFQATFLVLVRKASSVRWQAGLGTWLYAVAHRVALHARSQTCSRLLHEEQAARRPESASEQPDLSWREACALVHEELDRLPDRLRLPLLLCYLEGLSRDEAAAQLGLSTTTVKGRLERGRDLLRERLTRRGITLTAGLLAALTHSPARAAAPALAAMTVAAANCPSARVATLAQGVTATMILSKLKLAVGLLLAAGLIGVLLGARSGAAPTSAAPAARADGKAPARAGKEPAREGEVVGRVLDAAGKPVGGARVSLWTGKGKTPRVVETGSDGRFRVRLGKTDLERQVKLIAQAKGHGPDWVDLRRRPAGEVILRLSEDVPIQGRVVDLEGRGVAGVSVRVQEVARAARGDLKAYLDAWEKIMRGVAIPPLVSVPPEALGVTLTTTDRQGRFRLAGFGRERKVDLAIWGRGIEQQWVTVVTRPGFKKGTGYARGPSFQLLVGPGKELVGVVKDREGRPVKGARVSCQVGQAHTDERGRFRIEGLRKQRQYFVWTGGPGYFPAMSEVKDTPGREPVRLEVEIQRGLYVEGRLRDRSTGKPVSGVVSYYVRPDNPHLKNYRFSRSVGTRPGSAGPDGKFRILTIPGPGYLAVQADRNTYTRATLEGWDGAPVEAAPHALFPHYDHAIAPIDPNEKKPASRKCEITLEPGLSASGSIVGPDGKPVTGAIVFGLTAVPDPGSRTFPRPARFGPPPPARQKGSTFTAVGLNPREPRHLVFIHPEKKLGKVARLKGDEKRPLVVKLEPLGAVCGRVCTRAGKPAADRIVTPGPPNLFAFYKDYPIELLHNDQHQPQRSGRLIRWLPGLARTDEHGKFRIDGLVGGLKYRLLVTDRPYGVGVVPSHEKEVMVESGKTKDLGDLRRFW
jgi:RNA polymerase sigma factor (sigma-70 family)